MGTCTRRARLIQRAALRLSPSDALRAWSWFVRHPWHRLWDPTAGCGVMECCPNPPELRWILDVAVAVLPTKDARTLRKQIAALDEQW
ncbi:hypothetical protein FHX75_12506 [Micromonospora palomenae]|uniref:Uncharacterized protein n=1 Tax=Micromonospora palomenae TaxID=1461247 RepID=A0A561WDP5_9ACTN|nr:hypothetical protein FHX75_12506 [Micromonospora palomenae]